MHGVLASAAPDILSGGQTKRDGQDGPLAEARGSVGQNL
jgi:hypothetical protein